MLKPTIIVNKLNILRKYRSLIYNSKKENHDKMYEIWNKLSNIEQIQFIRYLITDTSHLELWQIDDILLSLTIAVDPNVYWKTNGIPNM